LLFDIGIALKYCSACIQKLLISSFLANAFADLGSKVFKTCIACRGKSKSKRKALQQLDLNIPPKKRATACTRPKPLIPSLALLELCPEATFLPNLPESCPEATIPSLNLPKSCPRATIPSPNLPARPRATIPPPNPPELCLETYIPIPTLTLIQPQALGFLLANQWQYIQNFNAAIDKVKIETCIQCKECWFSIDLKHKICYRCFNQDKGNKTPFLISAENKIDLGEILAYLPKLTQVEEIIIAWSYIQIIVYRYRGH
jgi:hypothetical protein